MAVVHACVLVDATTPHDDRMTMSGHEPLMKMRLSKSKDDTMIVAGRRLCLSKSQDDNMKIVCRRKIYPYQTKILEGLTKCEIRIFEALFKGVSTRFGLVNIEKSVENMDSSFVNPSKIFVWGA